MIEPRIRSNITGDLPDGHWLLSTVPDDEWPCSRCHYVIYRRRPPVVTPDLAERDFGTLITWVEHGLVVGDPNPELPGRPYLLCILCFRSYFTTWPIMHQWWFLNDDGTPQETRHGEWAKEALVEHEYTGVDLLNDPPVEMEGYLRYAPVGDPDPVATKPTPIVEAPEPPPLLFDETGANVLDENGNAVLA